MIHEVTVTSYLRHK